MSSLSRSELAASKKSAYLVESIRTVILDCLEQTLQDEESESKLTLDFPVGSTLVNVQPSVSKLTGIVFNIRTGEQNRDRDPKPIKMTLSDRETLTHHALQVVETWYRKHQESLEDLSVENQIVFVFRRGRIAAVRLTAQQRVPPSGEQGSLEELARHAAEIARKWYRLHRLSLEDSAISNTVRLLFDQGRLISMFLAADYYVEIPAGLDCGGCA